MTKDQYLVARFDVTGKVLNLVIGLYDNLASAMTEAGQASEAIPGLPVRVYRMHAEALAKVEVTWDGGTP